MTNSGHAHNIRFIQQCHITAHSAGTEMEKLKETMVCSLPKISRQQKTDGAKMEPPNAIINLVIVIAPTISNAS